MSNCVIGWPFYSDVGVLYTPTLSGGSWRTGDVALTNVQDSRLEHVARSTDALLTSTKFEIDLGVARAVRLCALPKHNFSSAALVRVRGGSVAGLGSGVVYNSGWVAGWPVGETAETTEDMNVGFTKVFDSDQTARYWMIEVDDTANPDGYVDIGRLVLAAGWQPTINMALGSGLGVDDMSIIDDMDGGAITVNERLNRRTIRLAIKNLGVDESLTRALDMMRIAGRRRQVHIVWDPTDTTHMHRRSFTGYMRQMNPIEWPEALYTAVGFEIVEAR